MRFFSCMCPDVNSQGAGLDESLATDWVGTRMISRARMSVVMSLQIGLSAKALMPER